MNCSCSDSPMCRFRSDCWGADTTFSLATSATPLDQHLLDLADRLGGVEALGTGFGAVHDRVATIQLERVFEGVEPLAGGLVARIRQPAVGLQQGRRAEVAV